MRFGGYGVIRRLGSMAKEVKVEPYSMAFVTAPDNEVAKKLAGGLGKIARQILGSQMFCNLIFGLFQSRTNLQLVSTLSQE